MITDEKATMFNAKIIIYKKKKKKKNCVMSLSKKLMLYTLIGTAPPQQTLPVVLDVGTDHKEIFADPLYQ